MYSKNAFSFVGGVGSKLYSNTKDILNEWYQNFKNNLGRKVKANGIELEGISYITYMVLTDPDYVDTNEKELYVGLYHYYLEDAKIVKVY